LALLGEYVRDTKEERMQDRDVRAVLRSVGYYSRTTMQLPTGDRLSDAELKGLEARLPTNSCCISICREAFRRWGSNPSPPTRVSRRVRTLSYRTSLPFRDHTAQFVRSLTSSFMSSLQTCRPRSPMLQRRGSPTQSFATQKSGAVHWDSSIGPADKVGHVLSRLICVVKLSAL